MGGLVLLSLILITISFRQPTGGALHRVEAAGATVLRPFEVAAERVARPFRDVYGYFAGLVHVKAENSRLKQEVNQLRQQALQGESAQQQNRDLRAQLRFIDSPLFPSDYSAVNTRIISWATEFDQQVMIAAGSDNGIVQDTPIVTRDGLVGRVTDVTGSGAQVTLLTDENSAVPARDEKTGAIGLVRHGQGEGSLLLDFVAQGGERQRGRRDRHGGQGFEQVPLALPRWDSDRCRHERRPERHGALQADPDRAVRRLLDARRGDGSDHPQANPEGPLMSVDAAKAAALLFIVVVIQLSVLANVDILGGRPNLILVDGRLGRRCLRGSIFGAVAGFCAGLLADTGVLGTLGFTRAAADPRGLLDRPLRRDDRPRPRARAAALRRRHHRALRGRRRWCCATCSASPRLRTLIFAALLPTVSPESAADRAGVRAHTPAAAAA